MASDLLSIAASGARAARLALDVTAQNIANASTDGYVRQSAQLQELAITGGPGQIGDVSLSGVSFTGVTRNVDIFQQAEVRRTGADAARGTAEVTGLEDIQTAVENSNVYPSITKFEGTLQQLGSDPTNSSLRAAVVESARTMSSTFNIAATSLDAVGTSSRLEASNGVTQVNQLAGELAQVNLNLSRAAGATSDKSSLLDQRDSLLGQISQYTDVTTTVASDQTVEVRLGGSAGPQLVSGGNASTMAMATAADGTISFTLGGAALSPTAGSLAGTSLALVKLRDVHTQLDTIAAGLVSTVNSAQANGVALDGSAGQQMLAGNSAGTMAPSFQDGSLIATAPAGAGANSRDPGNLTALNTALGNPDPAAAMDGLLFDISSTVAGRKVTSDALNTIAGNAKTAQDAQSGVSLDQEATNLIRYQQAFQASGKAMQVASTLFDTLFNLK